MKRLHLILGAVLMVSAAVLTACSGDDIVTAIPSQETAYPTDAWHVKIIAGKGLNNTRALDPGSDVGGEAGVIATWTAGDRVTVWKGETKVGTLTAQSGGSHETTLEGTLTGSFSAGDQLTLHYEVPDDRVLNYNDQRGTLSDISMRYDYASAIVTVTTVNANVNSNDLGSLGTGNATFENHQAICRFTFKKDGAAMNVSKLTIGSASGLIQGADHDKNGRGFITIQPATATNVLYVAMRNEYEMPDVYTFIIETPEGDRYYKQSATDADGIPTGTVAIEDGYFYPAEINSWIKIERPSIPEPDPTPITPTPTPTTPKTPITPVINPTTPETDEEEEEETIEDLTRNLVAWPIITSDGHLVTYGFEATAHNWGHPVGLVVAFDGDGGLAMALSDAGDYQWSTLAQLHEYKFSGSTCGNIDGARLGPWGEAKEGWDPGSWTACSGSQFHIENGVKQSRSDQGHQGNQIVQDDVYCKQQGDCIQYWANGEENTTKLVSCTGGYSFTKSNGDVNTLPSHSHPAAMAANSYSETLPPNATSGWFLPSAYDFLKAEMGAGGINIHINKVSYYFRQGYAGNLLSNFNRSLYRAHSNEDSNLASDTNYWLSNEISWGSAGYFRNGQCHGTVYSGALVEERYFNIGGNTKTSSHRVRPFFRFKFSKNVRLTNNYSLRLYGEFREDLPDV